MAAYAGLSGLQGSLPGSFGQGDESVFGFGGFKAACAATPVPPQLARVWGRAWSLVVDWRWLSCLMLVLVFAVSLRWVYSVWV